MIFVILACVIAGFAIYALLIRPWFVPLTKRIPHGREYLPTIGSRLSQQHGR